MVKYIFQKEPRKWVVTNTKNGRAIKTFSTKKAAIAYVQTLPNVEQIVTKQKNRWVSIVGPTLVEKNQPVNLNNNHKVTNQGKSAIVEVDQILEITSEITGVKTNEESHPFRASNGYEYRWTLLMAFGLLLGVIIAIVLISLFLI